MKQLDPKAVWQFFIQQSWTIFVFGSVFVIFATTVTSLATGQSNSGGSLRLLAVPAISILIVVGALVIGYIWARLTYYYYKYELTPNGFKKEYGVIYKKYVTIPYEKIQNVDINRSLLARLLGLSDLQIQTAGMSVSMNRFGGLAEGRLPGLSVQEAETLRDELINRSKTVQPHI